jgi:hypothetical protein
MEKIIIYPRGLKSPGLEYKASRSMIDYYEDNYSHEFIFDIYGETTENLPTLRKDSITKIAWILQPRTRPTIVNRAINETVTNIGQLSETEVTHLEKAVKFGILQRTANYLYPTHKTMYQGA